MVGDGVPDEDEDGDGWGLELAMVPVRDELASEQVGEVLVSEEVSAEEVSVSEGEAGLASPKH
jgi:hypothetical protein